MFLLRSPRKRTFVCTSLGFDIEDNMVPITGLSLTYDQEHEI